MDEHGAALAAAIEEVLPGWVERSVASVLVAAGMEDDQAPLHAELLGRRAADDIGAAVRLLLSLDIDEQATTPLTLLRGAVRYPTAVLRDAGVPPVRRDDVKVRLFPDDDYDLAPATFGDVDPRLTEPGLGWGAAKAYEHLRRHPPQKDGT